MNLPKKKILKSELVIKRSLPINFNADDLHLFKHELEIKTNSIYFYQLKNVILVDDTLITLPFLKFYPQETHLNGSFSNEIKKKYIKKITLPSRKISKAIWITQNWTWMYFHWFTDALTRYIACKELINDHKVVLPITYKKYPFISESLDFLDIPYFWYDDKKNTFVKQLILPSHTAVPGNYNEIYINNLRNLFISKLTNSTTNNRKVFISRKKANLRQIQNEQGLELILFKYGFEVHCLEDYSFTEQIILISEASHLIGVHGGGLTNMIFTQSNVKVLEIRMKDDFENNCYFSLASALKIPYFYHEADLIDKQSLILKLDLNKIEQVIIDFL